MTRIVAVARAMVDYYDRLRCMVYGFVAPLGIEQLREALIADGTPAAQSSGMPHTSIENNERYETPEITRHMCSWCGARTYVVSMPQDGGGRFCLCAYCARRIAADLDAVAPVPVAGWPCASDYEPAIEIAAMSAGIERLCQCPNESVPCRCEV